MLYIIRNEEGRITSLLESYQPGAEKADLKSKEVLDFLSVHDAEFNADVFLEKSDMLVARIFEDLVDVLINKNVIMFTDLPEIAQQKLLSRKLVRNMDSQEEKEQAKETSSFLIEDSNTI